MDHFKKNSNALVHMDLITTKEAYGYETIADAELAEAKALGEAIGEARGVAIGEARGVIAGGLAEKRRMAKTLLLQGMQIHIITTVTGLSEAEILAL